MTTYYVSPTGNNSNSGTSQGSPFATFAKANTVAVSGDSIRGLNGIIKEQINVKSGVSYSALNEGMCEIACESTRNFGFVANSVNGFQIHGFKITNPATAGITISKCWNFQVLKNDITGAVGNGISIEKSDMFSVKWNRSYLNAKAGAQSGISLLMLQDYSPDPTPTNGFRCEVMYNIVYGNIVASGSKSDGNGIIFDKLHYNAVKYSGKCLCAFNIVYGNGGSGIRVMASKDVYVRHNTCYGNFQDSPTNRKPASDTWRGELQNQWSFQNYWEWNIAVSTSDVITATNLQPCYPFMNCYTENYNNGEFGPQGGNVFTKNLLWSASKKTTKGSPSGAQQPALGTGYITGDPLFTNAAAGDFSLKPGSPALGAAENGLNIGAWQSEAPPYTPVTPLSAPVITTSEPWSGGTYTITSLGTYAGTPTITSIKAQTLSSGVWTTTQNLDDGHVVVEGDTFTFPTVAAGTDFTIRSWYTGAQGESGANRSNVITIQPEAPVTPVDPDPVDPDPDPDLTSLAAAVAELQTAIIGLTSKANANTANTADNTSRITAIEVATTGVPGRVTTLEGAIGAISTTQETNQQNIALLFQQLANVDGVGVSTDIPLETLNVSISGSDWTLVRSGNGTPFTYELLAEGAGSIFYGASPPGELFGHRLMPYKERKASPPEGTNLYYRGRKGDILIITRGS